MGVSGCIQSTLSGTILVEIEVQPGSTRQGIIGYNEWRGRLQVAVKADAEKGKANNAVCNVLSHQLGCKVEIVSGHSSRFKKIKVNELDVTDIISRVDELIESK